MINDCGISLPGKDLLDIGCAYGPFLLAAREKGLRPRGLDVSEEAVRYVGQTLNLPAAGGDFMDFRSVEVFGISSFDIVTLWYVIEHFQDPGGAMGKLAALVRPGGVLAFATPHRRGVTGRFFPELFYRQSPKDHFTLWDPKSAERVLSVYGFKIRKIRITGHHPERFPRFMIRVFGYYLCGIISKIFRLGDTFEVYADKERRES